MGKDRPLYIGVDVGGTKILAAAATETGAVVAREKQPTPRHAPMDKVIEAILATTDALLDKKRVRRGEVQSIGVAIAGVVDPDAGEVVFSPNTSLTGAKIGPLLKKKHGVPSVIGNDVNLGTLAEYWFGAAGRARDVVGIFPGTGIGGGVIIDGKLLRGRREFGGEIGHMIVQIGGPKCGCGQPGCLEAIASRTAIERDIRAAVAAGKKCFIADQIKGKGSVIKSGMIRAALDAKDEVVTGILRNAAEVLGLACINIRHLLDPEIIVLGGGLIEACGDFIVPIVERVLAGDTLTGSRPGAPVQLAQLGDDAVVLGGVACAMELVGLTREKIMKHVPQYPRIEATAPGSVTVDGEIYEHDLVIRANGEIVRRKKKKIKERYGTSHVIDEKELERVCRGDPDVLVIGAGQEGQCALSEDGAKYLKRRGIRVETAPSPQAAGIYNAATGRKALLMHVTC